VVNPTYTSPFMSCLLRLDVCVFFVPFLCVCLCTGHFVMVPLNMTCLHCVQHSFCEHLLNLYYTKPLQRSKLKQCFTAFTECDQVLAFGRRGKISAWTVLKSRPSVTQGYQTLSSTPTCAQVEECFPAIEIFVVLLYDRLSV